MVSNGVKETAAWKQFYLILDIESVHICRTTKLLFLLGETLYTRTCTWVNALYTTQLFLIR